MATFRKATLKVGRYHSPDGILDVTPDRLRHWSRQFHSMKQAKQVVPIGWDHSENEEQLKPVSLSTFQKRRSAKGTIGRLSDFEVSEDGQSAVATLDVRTEKAKEAAELNNVYISPVIFDAWKDGHGNNYRDVITHVDFVNHPVDHSQGPFVPVEPGHLACAIRMGLSPQPFRMAQEAPMADDDKGKKASGDDSGGTGGEPKDNGGKLKDVIAALGTMDIVLSDDTNEENFLPYLHQALLTAAAHRGEDGGDDGGGPELAPEDAGYATMSLQAKNAYAFAERSHRERIKDRLDGLLKSGRCKPTEHKEQIEALPSIKLSLGEDGNPKPGAVEAWIDSREGVPEGSFWDSSTKTRMSAVTKPPENFTGEIGDKEADEIAKTVVG